VIPLRTGFGMKFKTLESMAAGTPVVASDRGLEGMAVEEPLRALRANTVDEYIKAISRLFEDQDLRQTLSRNGRDYIEQNYTWEILGEQYADLLEKSIDSTPS
jgi:glycosyltransferase involved in cell wall biosynthesis